MQADDKMGRFFFVIFEHSEPSQIFIDSILFLMLKCPLMLFSKYDHSLLLYFKSHIREGGFISRPGPAKEAYGSSTEI